MNNYQLLISRLDAFIRKYYANQLLRGFLIFGASVLGFFLLASLGEYYFYFPSWLRYTLLSSFVGLGLFALVQWIILPFLHMQRLGKIISHEKAADIIGIHFPNVQDKLLNVLQLRQRIEDQTSRDLIEASIDQKTRELSPVPFQTAISYATNRKYLPFLLIPALAVLFIFFAAPNIFRESTKRLLDPSRKYVPQVPFVFHVLNSELRVPQYDDYEVKLKMEGHSLPEQVLIRYNGQEVVMQKQGQEVFTHTFFKCSRDVSFSFAAAGFTSESHVLQVVQKPLIKQFRISVDYPDYTGRKDEVLDNIGDLIAPQGTVVSWVFNTEHTDQIDWVMGGHAVSLGKQGTNFFYSYRFMHDTTYDIVLSNKQVTRHDSLHYQVSVIPDQFPSIQVQQYNDSLTGDYVLFVGEAGDDYGVKNVTLHYTIKKTNEKGVAVGQPKSGSINVPVKPGVSVPFNQMLDIRQLHLDAGDQLSYYFAACDNDAVNGSKCTRSVTFSYEKPTEKQLDSILQKNQEQINRDLNNTARQNDKMDQEIKQMQEKLLDKNELDWEDKKKVEDMVKRNENVQQEIEHIKKKFELNKQQSSEKNYSDQVKDKQENIEKLLDELKNNELDAHMKKLEELMKLLDKDKLFEQLKQTEQDNNLMEKDLDRMVEMMKQLERDMRMEDIAHKAEELAKKQDELNKETEAGKKAEELAKKQDELNKEMNGLKKDMEELAKLNESMNNKKDLDEMKKEEKDAEQSMENSSNELKSGQSSKASKSQKKAKESLEKLAKKMEESASGGDSKELEIDEKATRQILTNLIRMSFSQEDLMNVVKTTAISDPGYVKNIKVQQKLKIDARMIADSLFALSKRLSMISSTVNKEIDGINRHMDNGISFLEQRNVPQSSVELQYIMTGANNLALMLNEVLQQLQQQEANAKQKEGGGGSCNKPGGSKPSGKSGKGMGMQLGDIITKQEQLGKSMKQLKDKLGKQGDKPGDKLGDKQGNKPGQQNRKPGQEGDDGSEMSGGDSEQMARIAAQQAALRKQLNDLNNQLRKDGKSNPNLTRIQNDMDRNETDIVNRRITGELLQRQSQILSRLLEAKDALRQQEQGEERESRSAKDLNHEIPDQLKNILRNQQSVLDYYKTVPAELKPYYRQLVEQYFQLIR